MANIVSVVVVVLFLTQVSFAFFSASKHSVFGPSSRSLHMKIIRLSSKTMKTLLPKSISNDQWKSYWGRNDLERLQKAMESLLVSYGGGWLVWLLSFQVGTLISGIVGTLLIFNWIYTPILNARRRNGTLVPRFKKLHYALFEGEIAGISRVKRRAGKTVGAASQEFLTLHVEDEAGCQLEILTQWQSSYTDLRKGMRIINVIASSKSSFSELSCVTDSWVPSADVWVGDYPYLDKKAFRAFVVAGVKKRAVTEVIRDDQFTNDRIQLTGNEDKVQDFHAIAERKLYGDSEDKVTRTTVMRSLSPSRRSPTFRQESSFAAVFDDDEGFDDFEADNDEGRDDDIPGEGSSRYSSNPVDPKPRVTTVIRR